MFCASSNAGSIVARPSRHDALLAVAGPVLSTRALAPVNAWILQRVISFADGTSRCDDAFF
jgi:hypothetical protein